MSVFLLPSSNFEILIHINHLRILEWTEESYDLLKFKKKIPDVKCMTFSTHCLFIGTATEFFIVDLNTFEERSKYSRLLWILVIITAMFYIH